MPNDQLMKQMDSERQAVASLLEAISAQGPITSNEDYGHRAEQVKDIKRRWKALKAQQVEVTRPLDLARKAVMELFRTPLEFLVKAEGILKYEATVWTQKVERERALEEARQREIARKETERLERRAAAAAQKGHEEKAEVLAQAAAAIPLPIVAAPARPPGMVGSTRWSARVTDLRALCKAVGEGIVGLEAVQANMTFLNAQTRAMRENLLIPGVEAVKTESMSVRT